MDTSTTGLEMNREDWVRLSRQIGRGWEIGFLEPLASDGVRKVEMETDGERKRAV